MNVSKEQLRDRMARALKNRRPTGLTPSQLRQAATGKPVIAPSPKPVPVRRPRVSKPAVMRPTPRDDVLFLSGSIGDVLALECFLTDADRQSLSVLYYATQKYAEIERLFRAVPSFPNLRDHHVAWSDFTHFWCFFSKEDCVTFLRSSRRDIHPALAQARDFSITAQFPRVHSGQLRYNGSSFVRHAVADLGRFVLPEAYAVVCPYSTDKRITQRDFDAQDWEHCVRYLRHFGLKGVVLNTGTDPVPADESLLDWSNATTIAEAVEITKGARAYVGIDSSMSVLAPKVMPPDRLVVKSVNGHCYENAACYYAPLREFPFLRRAVRYPFGQ